MLFKLQEFEKWLGFSTIEIWLNLVSWTIFTVLLTLKAEEFGLVQLSWGEVFYPLVINDCLSLYFWTIVVIREFLGGYGFRFCRNVKNILRIFNWTIFKHGLVQHLTGEIHLDFLGASASLMAWILFEVMTLCCLKN